jgi:hypothetical protein
MKAERYIERIALLDAFLLKEISRSFDFSSERFENIENLLDRKRALVERYNKKFSGI